MKKKTHQLGYCSLQETFWFLNLKKKKKNYKTPENKKNECQEWDSNPRLHSETRTPAPIAQWEGKTTLSLAP